jgi:DNA-binding FadR family transcriptional regulator
MKAASDGTLSKRVTKYLIKHIQNNDLKPGDRVPSEVKVSGVLKISRGVVRQAYHSLPTAGILEIAMGRSPRVGELSHDSFTPLFSQTLTTAQASIEDILELRVAVEIHAAELAAIHRTHRHVEALRKAVQGMRKNVNDQDRSRKSWIRTRQSWMRSKHNTKRALAKSWNIISMKPNRRCRRHSKPDIRR